MVWEIIYMGVLILATSYVMHLHAFKKGLGNENHEIKAPEEYDDDGNPLNPVKTSNPFIKKWLDFGGGYYGIVAFIKLLFLELEQLKGFVAQWEGLGPFIESLGIGWLIEFFVEQFQNFVQAIIWPTDYLGDYPIYECIAFVVITYILYEVSRKLARDHFQKTLA